MLNRLRIFVLLACTFVPSVGLAQKKAAPRRQPQTKSTSAVDKRVEKAYNQGVRAAEKGQWEKAEQSFEEAFALDPLPQIAANLGNAELQQGKACEAAEHLDYFLHKDKDTDEEGRAEIKALYDAATKQVVIVDLTVDQVGADLFVDNEIVGKSPLDRTLCLAPGVHRFEATLAGAEPGSQALKLDGGSKVGVLLKMGEAKTSIVSPMRPIVTEKPVWRKPATIGLFGLATVGIGLGIGFSIAGYLKGDEADSFYITNIKGKTPETKSTCGIDGWEAHTDDCKYYDGKLKTQHALNLASIAPYVVGSGALAGALVIALQNDASSHRGKITPVVGPGYQGIVITAEF